MLGPGGGQQKKQCLEWERWQITVRQQLVEQDLKSREKSYWRVIAKGDNIQSARADEDFEMAPSVAGRLEQLNLHIP